jgi:hypothetical protein
VLKDGLVELHGFEMMAWGMVVALKWGDCSKVKKERHMKERPVSFGEN